MTMFDDQPEQPCDCKKILLVLEVGDLHASAYCEVCKHDVWIGRDIPEGPATRRGSRSRTASERSAANQPNPGAGPGDEVPPQG